MKEYQSMISLRIDWSEIDLFEHINNLAIMKYVQAGRVNFLEAIGLMQSQAEQKVGPILASTNCQFLKPLYYPGNAFVYTKVEGIKNTSFEMAHILLDNDQDVVARAKDIIVYFDFNKGTKLQIPDLLRKTIEEIKLHPVPLN